LVDPKVIEFVIGDEPQGQMMRDRAAAQAQEVGDA
jgi:hypothetical protein